MKKTYLLLLGMFLFGIACQTEPAETTETYVGFRGETMGTTYEVKYKDRLNQNFKAAIDQILIAVNSEVSTYIPSSFISSFNKTDKEIQYLNILDQKLGFPKHFKANFEKSKEVFKNSQGYFDPTVMPVVNYWGFGYTEKKAVEEVDKLRVDSLMNSVGFGKITQRSSKDGWIYLKKENPGVQLDFSAIAKGYGVDAIAAFLKENNIEDYYVEIGGELVVSGKNPQGNWWTIGINQPKEESGLTEMLAKVELQNRAMATSGNYRNFYEVNGVKYAHTINPKTGFPEKNTLLSASIFAPDCMTADAYATACMTMGLEKGSNMIEGLKEIDAYFLYSDENGKILSKSTNENYKPKKIQDIH